MSLNDISHQQRNIIFISHATPEDNDFTIWLASRLQADGYDVWIDKHALLGGEKFWQDIDQVIRHQAIKFLLVYSKNICYQQTPGILKDGVNKEKSLAESIARDNTLTDFIILLNADGSEYNLFIGADMLNQIPFYDNWASGYSQLQKKFKKDGLEPAQSVVGDFSRWFEDEYVINNGVKELREVYYDSWWPIQNLPQAFYMYVFANDVVAREVQQQLKYPASRVSNIVATFYNASDFEIVMEGQTGKINFTNKHEIKISEVLAGIGREGFPSKRDAENHLRSLLQRIFHIIMRERGLRWHDMANRKLAYFFTPRINPKIKFVYSRRTSKRTKRKSIFGKHLNSTWHFALSAKPVLSPQLAFSLKSHIVFTSEGYNLWNDKDKMHSARRKKGRLMFNEDWRDMLFAFLHALSNGGSTVTTELSPSFTMSLRPWTNTYESNFGYTEPKEKDRYNILDADDEYFENEVDLDAEEVIDV